MPPDLEEFVAKVRRTVSQPLCVGFGISTPGQAKQVAQIADGVIVGSRIIQLMEAEEDPPAKVADFVKGLRVALDD
jgi:tryptophan synthase alpha chain